MGLLNKLVISFGGAVLLGTSAMAADYKVGDKMPEFKVKADYTEAWYNDEGSKQGEILYYGKDGNERFDFIRAYRDCNGKKVFFAYFDGSKLYLDNNPNDGIIDKVYDSIEGRTAQKDAPNCIKK